MNLEKIANLIKNLRKKSGLTQSEFAEKYHVSYQAVSKWENAKSIPDIAILKQICEDYNISLDTLTKHKKSNKTVIISAALVILTILASFIIHHFKSEDFTFKTITSNCSNFNISGNIAYNKNKSFLHLSNITYCGGEDEKNYKFISCTLYEKKSNDLIKSLDEVTYDNNKSIKLEKFLKDIEFSLDNFSKECVTYNDSSLFLKIKAVDENNNDILYEVPLNLKEICPK